MARDFYAILGVSKGASQDDIKSAYRKLSKELHPDKHKGDKSKEDRFKEVNQAYEVLGDPQKRQRYDQFGEAGANAGSGFGGGQGFGGFDFSGFQQGDMGGFADLFGDLFGGQRAQRQSDEGGDLEVQISLPLKDVIAETERTFKVRKFITCDHCTGTGSEKGTQMKTCPECTGTGQVTRTAQSLFGRIQQRMLCPTCKGAGKIPEKPCKKCDGEGRVQENATVTIKIPAGIDHGQTLRIRGEGHAGRRKAASGDLYVHIRIEKDPRFTREGADIHGHAMVHVLDAILGTEISVETLHGNVTLKVPEGTQPGTVLRIKGKGLPVLSSSRHGDHFVEIHVEIPKKLSRSERRILEDWKSSRD
jgi:molecular chaperone DnaJ